MRDFGVQRTVNSLSVADSQTYGRECRWALIVAGLVDTRFCGGEKFFSQHQMFHNDSLHLKGLCSGPKTNIQK